MFRFEGFSSVVRFNINYQLIVARTFQVIRVEQSKLGIEYEFDGHIA